MYCASVLSLITNTGKRMFIKIKWQSIIRSYTDLINYTKVNQPLKAIKEGCKTMIQSADNNIAEVTKYKALIEERIDELFAKNLRKIDQYKAKLAAFFRKRFKEVVNDICNSDPLRPKSMGLTLFQSIREQEKLFSQEPCEVFAPEKKAIPNIYQNLCKFELLDIADLIFDESLKIFFPNLPVILTYSIEEGTLEEVNLNDETVIWKSQSSWCCLPNGDVIYTGGEYNKKASPVCYLINYDNKVTEIASFIPKKSHCLCMFGEDVFCFGGNSQIAQKYDTRLKLWEKLAPGPDILGYSSACALDQSIIISTFIKKELFVYSVLNNSYSIISPTPFSTSSSKLLIRYKHSLFCLTKNKLFQSDLTAKNWEEISNKLPEENWCSVMNPQVIEDKIYFILENYKIYALSVNSWKVQEQKIMQG